MLKIITILEDLFFVHNGITVTATFVDRADAELFVAVKEGIREAVLPEDLTGALLAVDPNNLFPKTDVNGVPAWSKSSVDDTPNFPVPDNPIGMKFIETRNGRMIFQGRQQEPTAPNFQSMADPSKWTMSAVDDPIDFPHEEKSADEVAKDLGIEPVLADSICMSKEDALKSLETGTFQSLNEGLNEPDHAAIDKELNECGIAALRKLGDEATRLQKAEREREPDPVAEFFKAGPENA